MCCAQEPLRSFAFGSSGDGSRADGRKLTSVCRLPSALLDLVKTVVATQPLEGGSSALDLPDFSPAYFPACCRKHEIMRKLYQACLSPAARLCGSDQSWLSPSAGLRAQPPTNEPPLTYRGKTHAPFERDSCEVRHSLFLRKDGNQTRCPCIY